MKCYNCEKEFEQRGNCVVCEECISADHPSHDTGEGQYCPRRGEGPPGPFGRVDEETPDTWKRRGKDWCRVCSFCGSIHPEDFEACLDKALAGEDITIGLTDKSYKVYVHRLEVPNASLGGIKFYSMHANQADDPDGYLKRVNGKLNRLRMTGKAR